MSGYPAGAEHDSRAPYNETEDLCRYCDYDKAWTEEEEMRANLCYECHKEEQAEMRRDER